MERFDCVCQIVYSDGQRDSESSPWRCPWRCPERMSATAEVWTLVRRISCSGEQFGLVSVSRVVEHVRMDSLRFFSPQLELALHHELQITSGLCCNMSEIPHSLAARAYLHWPEVISCSHQVLGENVYPFYLTIPFRPCFRHNRWWAEKRCDEV